MHDVSAAFDTVDHGILIKRLSISYGIVGSALEWFRSNLTSRSQTVCIGNAGLDTVGSEVVRGVPQGSMLGPLLYILHSADVRRVVESSRFSSHLYADDIQMYGFCKGNEAAGLLQIVNNLVGMVCDWMSSNKLRLNIDKTKFMWIGTTKALMDRCKIIKS